MTRRALTAHVARLATGSNLSESGSLTSQSLFEN